MARASQAQGNFLGMAVRREVKGLVDGAPFGWNLLLHLKPLAPGGHPGEEVRATPSLLHRNGGTEGVTNGTLTCASRIGFSAHVNNLLKKYTHERYPGANQHRQTQRIREYRLRR